MVDMESIYPKMTSWHCGHGIHLSHDDVMTWWTWNPFIPRWRHDMVDMESIYPTMTSWHGGHGIHLSHDDVMTWWTWNPFIPRWRHDMVDMESIYPTMTSWHGGHGIHLSHDDVMTWWTWNPFIPRWHHDMVDIEPICLICEGVHWSLVSEAECVSKSLHPWRRHQMETFPCYWPFVRGIQRPSVNSPHKGQWRGVFFDLRLNKRLNKPSWGWWFETPSRPFWRHCNGHEE